MKTEGDRKFLSLFVAVIALLSFIAIYQNQKDKIIFKGQFEKMTIVYIGHQSLKAYVADTEITREKGLGDIESLPSDEAMLFMFDVPERYGFWMKDMRFPIDIFWIDWLGRVVFIKESVLPSSYPETFIPNVPAKYVLETNVGFAHENRVKIGDEISF